MFPRWDPPWLGKLVRKHASDTYPYINIWECANIRGSQAVTCRKVDHRAGPPKIPGPKSGRKSGQNPARNPAGILAGIRPEIRPESGRISGQEPGRISGRLIWARAAKMRCGARAPAHFCGPGPNESARYPAGFLAGCPPRIRPDSRAESGQIPGRIVGRILAGFVCRSWT